MNSTSLIMMIGTLSIVTIVTVYYFYKAFTTPSEMADDGKEEITRPDFT
ncbi:MAG: hypothetical protein ACOYLG_01910 [Chitinophagaceae bacterium]|jgi:hypothetical protein